MVSTVFALWTAMFPAQLDSDLTFADPSPKKPVPLKTEALLALTTQVLPSQPSLQLPADETRFIEVTVPLTGPSKDSLRAVPVSVRSGRAITVLPWAEVVELKQRTAIVRYVLRARATEAPQDVRFLLEVRSWDDETVGRLRVRHEIKVVPSEVTAELLNAYAQAYRYHQSLAQKAYRNLPELHDYLRLDRVDRPPAPRRVPPQKTDVFTDFLTHRLRADISQRRLRSAAFGKDAALAKSAVSALGGLSKKPTGPAARARAIEGVPLDRAVKMAVGALNDLQFDIAEGFLDRIRTSGDLNAELLAHTLALLGHVYAARGRQTSSLRAFGQALCIAPDLSSPVGHPFFKEAFTKAKATSKCKTPIRIRQVEAARVISIDDRPTIQVTISFGPDPYELISGGEVQIFGYGGAVFSTLQVRATDHQLIANFEDPGTPENAAGQILLKLRIQDTSGVDIATQGIPDPITTQLTMTEAFVDQSEGSTWWIWVLVGGIVAAGAGAGAAVWAANRDEEVIRGIGPIDVRF